VNLDDTVRVLDDPSWGYAPIGHVFELKEKWVRVALDDPDRWGRPYAWFPAHELEVVDIGAWEAAISDGAA
jgi:hypothetical protein